MASSVGNEMELIQEGSVATVLRVEGAVVMLASGLAFQTPIHVGDRPEVWAWVSSRASRRR